MSIRELRQFSEIMRVLGYPRLLSVENFRQPNFALVADLLYWLILRYEPLVKIPDDIDTEAQRIQFLTSAAAVMSTKARIQCVLLELNQRINETIYF
jgi:clusterin-associated protein 1